MAIAFTILGIFAVGLWEAWPIIQKRRWKDLSIYCAILGIGGAFLVWSMVTMDPYRVSHVIWKLYGPSVQWLGELLG